MNSFIKKNAIVFSAILLMVLILSGVGLSFFNSRVIDEYNTVRTENLFIKQELKYLMDGLEGMDIGVRGFALTKKDKLLDPYISTLRGYDANCANIENFIAKRQYEQVGDLGKVKLTFKKYHDFLGQMVEMARKDSMAEFVAMLEQDRGFEVWHALDTFQKELFAEEDQLMKEAQAKYEMAFQRNVIVQSIVLLVGLPTLLSMLVRIRRDLRDRQALLQELVNNNQTYIFNPGTESATAEAEAKEIVETSIVNFKQAHNFISHLSEGNYQVEWQGLNEKNSRFNENNLAGKLVKMKEQMLQSKQEDEKRLWATEGLAQFTEIIRKHQQDLSTLTQQVVAFLVKYLKVQQGSLFVLQEESGEKSLELSACYAFDRKKHVQKQIAIGQGLVGQAYLEAETTLLNQVPQGYTTITSGLGDATPGCLVVVPMKHNNRVEAVLELAGFQQYEPYQVAFLEKLGEIVASTVTTVRTNSKMQHLLEDSQMQTEQMRAQEEEMRQNMEELAATQEEVQRRENELRVQLVELQERTALEQREAELRATNEKSVKRSQQSKEKMEALDTEIENKTSQIKVLQKDNEELRQKLAFYESQNNA